MRRRALTTVLALLWLVRPASAVDVPDGKWERIEVDGFVIVTNAKDKKATELARTLGRLRTSLQMFSMVDEVQPLELRLYIFKDTESFQPYLPLYEGKPARYAGFTTGVPGATYMAFDLQSGHDPMDLLAHEFVHAFLRERAPRAPLWLSEGLAEFYTSFREDGDEVVIGESIRAHKELLASRPLLSAARLMLVDQSNAEYNEGQRQTSFYAQSWGSVHYLLTDKERRSALKDFLQRIHGGGERVLPAFSRSLADHFPDQQFDLKPYMDQRTIPFFRLPAPEREEETQAVRRRLEAPELLVLLGDLVTALGEDVQTPAAEFYHQSLALVPDQSSAHLGLAMDATFRRDYARAVEHSERAVAADPEGSTTNYLHGFLLYRQYADQMTGTELLGATPAILADAREHFRRALAAEPNNARAQAGIGLTYIMDKDPSAGIEPLRVAIPKIPWQNELTQTLVWLLCNQDQAEEAREVFERDVVPRSRPQDRRSLLAHLTTTELRVASQLAGAGDSDGAARVVSNALAGSNKGSDIARFQRLLAQMEVSEVVSRYNEVLALVRDGDYPEALDALEELMPEINNEQQIEVARKLHEQLQRLLKRRG